MARPQRQKRERTQRLFSQPIIDTTRETTPRKQTREEPGKEVRSVRLPGGKSHYLSCRSDENGDGVMAHCTAVQVNVCVAGMGLSVR